MNKFTRNGRYRFGLSSNVQIGFNIVPEPDSCPTLDCLEISTCSGDNQDGLTTIKFIHVTEDDLINISKMILDLIPKLKNTNTTKNA